MSRNFDNTISYQNTHQVDNNTNVVYLESLWKKQIQSMFMQIYYFKKQKMAMERAN